MLPSMFWCKRGAPPAQAGLAADARLSVEAMNVSHARVCMDHQCLEKAS